MSEARADERTTRNWGNRPHGHSPGRQYVSGPTVEPVPNRGEVKTSSVAGGNQGGHQREIVFVVGRDSTILSVVHPNCAAPGGDEVGRSIMVLFDREHSARIIRSFENLFASGEPQSFVCRGNPPLAAGAWYLCRVSANRGASGVESATVFVRDITEWKLNEDEFEGLSRFRAIMDHAGEAIFMTDARTGRIVDVNETACSWLGFSREMLLQMDVGDLDLEFPLESSDGVIDHIADTRDANRPKAFVRASHRRRNGTSFPVEVTLTRQRFGDRDFVLVVARDVKQRNHTKQVFLDGETERRGLFAISRDAGYCSARDGTVSEVNDSALEIFGYTRDEFIGLEARRLYRFPEQIRAFQHAVEEGGAVKNFHAEFQTKTGQSFRGLLGATKRHDSNGNVLGYQCLVSPLAETASLNSRDAVAQSKQNSEEATRRADALEIEAGRMKREIEEARSAAAAARADVEQAESLAAKARLDAEHRATELAIAKLDAYETKKRADALKREAEQAKREMEHARSETANALLSLRDAAKRADLLKREAEQVKREMEDARSETANALLSLRDATKRADALKREAEQAKREMEHARSETANALLSLRDATKRAARAEAEVEAALSEIEQAKLEAAGAKADAEQARSETAKAKLDAERAEERVQRMQREVESTMSETQRAVVEAANAWAALEKAERETSATRSATRAVTSDPKEGHTGQGTLVHVKRRLSTDILSSERGGAPVLTGPAVRHRRRTEPLMQPSRRRGTAAWLGVAVKKVAGLLALPSGDGNTGNRAATASDFLDSGVEVGRLPRTNITREPAPRE